jgi:hypothetical protein
MKVTRDSRVRNGAQAGHEASTHSCDCPRSVRQSGRGLGSAGKPHGKQRERQGDGEGGGGWDVGLGVSVVVIGEP